jgi:hypothetical protein
MLKNLCLYRGTTLATERVTISGKGSLVVTENLQNFLVELNLSNAKATHLFWADQISIDQNNLKERGHQVQLMGKIYSQAKVVYAYVGPKPDDSIFDADALAGPPTASKPECLSFDQYPENYWLTLIDLLTRDYWHRLWIVQELRLARAVAFWSGKCYVDAAQLHREFRHMLDLEGYVMLILKESKSTHARRLEKVAQELFKKQHHTISRLLKTQQRTILTPGEPLGDILYHHCWNHCSDLRDKVFGLQALVRYGERIPIDYSNSLGEVLRQTFAALVMRGEETDRLCSISEGLTGSALPDVQIVRLAYEVFLLPQRILRILANQIMSSGAKEKAIQEIIQTITSPRQQGVAKTLVDIVPKFLEQRETPFHQGETYVNGVDRLLKKSSRNSETNIAWPLDYPHHWRRVGQLQQLTSAINVRREHIDWRLDVPQFLIGEEDSYGLMLHPIKENGNLSCDPVTARFVGLVREVRDFMWDYATSHGFTVVGEFLYANDEIPFAQFDGLESKEGK